MEQKRKEDLVNSDDIFKYQLLSRLQGDCEYYLGMVIEIKSSYGQRMSVSR